MPVTRLPYILNRKSPIQSVYTVVELSDGVLAIAGEHPNIYILNIYNPNLYMLNFTTAYMTSVTKLMVLENNLLVSYSPDKVLRVWDPTNGELITSKSTQFTLVDAIPGSNKIICVVNTELHLLTYSSKIFKSRRIERRFTSIHNHNIYKILDITASQKYCVIYLHKSGEDLMYFVMKINFNIMTSGHLLAWAKGPQMYQSVKYLNKFLIIRENNASSIYGLDNISLPSVKPIWKYQYNNTTIIDLYDTSMAVAIERKHVTTIYKYKDFPIDVKIGSNFITYAVHVPKLNNISVIKILDKSNAIIVSGYIDGECIIAILTENPLKRRVVLSDSSNLSLPQTCEDYRSISGTFAVLREKLIAICKNSHKYDITCQTPQLNISLPDDPVVKIQITQGESVFEHLYKIWINDEHKLLFKTNIMAFAVEYKSSNGNISYGRGVTRSIIDDAIREVPNYLSSNDSFTWIPLPKPSELIRSSSSSHRRVTRDHPKYLLLQCFGKKRHPKIQPLQGTLARNSKPKYNTDKYRFIGELVAFGIIHNIKLRKHLSRNILQRLLKPNLVDSEYIYYGMEDSPATKPYVFKLLAHSEPDFTVLCEMFDVNPASVNLNKEIETKLKQRFSEEFDLNDNPNLEAFIDGFNFILAKDDLQSQKIDISNIDSFITIIDIDGTELQHLWDNIVFRIPENMGEFDEYLLHKLITNPNMFYEYVSTLSDDIALDLKNVYKPPNGHRTFISNLLKILDRHKPIQL
jgi:hypothetical protein